jgi:hypothetical protein
MIFRDYLPPPACDAPDDPPGWGDCIVMQVLHTVTPTLEEANNQAMIRGKPAPFERRKVMAALVKAVLTRGRCAYKEDLQGDDDCYIIFQTRPTKRHKNRCRVTRVKFQASMSLRTVANEEQDISRRTFFPPRFLAEEWKGKPKNQQDIPVYSKTRDEFWDAFTADRTLKKGYGKNLGTILIMAFLADFEEASAGKGKDFPKRAAWIESDDGKEERINIAPFFDTRNKFAEKVKNDGRKDQPKERYQWVAQGEVREEINAALDSGNHEDIIKAAMKGMTERLYRRLLTWRSSYNEWRDEVQKDSNVVSKEDVSSKLEEFKKRLFADQRNDPEESYSDEML